MILANKKTGHPWGSDEIKEKMKQKNYQHV